MKQIVKAAKHRLENAGQFDNPNVDPVLRVFAGALPNLSVKGFPCNAALGYTDLYTFKPCRKSERVWGTLERMFLDIGCSFYRRDEIRFGMFGVYILECKFASQSLYSQGLVNGESGIIQLG